MLIPVDVLLVFLTASTALALAPGPDNIFVLTQSAVHGRVAGIVVTLGLMTGVMVHSALVAVGVAAIFQTSATAFTALKLAGAAYLDGTSGARTRARDVAKNASTDSSSITSANSKSLLAQGQQHRELGTVKARFLVRVVAVVCPDTAVMPLDNLTDDAQAQPTVIAKAVVLGPVGIETLEHPHQTVGRDAWALIAHLDLEHARVIGQHGLDLAALGAKGLGIVKQVQEHLGQTVANTQNISLKRCSRDHLERDGVLAGRVPRLSRFDQAADQLMNVDTVPSRPADFRVYPA